MIIILHRSYLTSGTQGVLMCEGKMLAFTIELPWLNNVRQRSCIPEGTYNLSIAENQRFGKHLKIEKVPNRDAILIHPANDALRELRGCLAPVSYLSGLTSGGASRKAMEKLMELAEKAANNHSELLLKITS